MSYSLNRTWKRKYLPPEISTEAMTPGVPGAGGGIDVEEKAAETAKETVTKFDWKTILWIAGIGIVLYFLFKNM